MGCMGKIGLAIILVMPCVRAQPFQDLLLRQSAHIAGVLSIRKENRSSKLALTTRTTRRHTERTRRADSNWTPWRPLSWSGKPDFEARWCGRKRQRRYESLYRSALSLNSSLPAPALVDTTESTDGGHRSISPKPRVSKRAGKARIVTTAHEATTSKPGRGARGSGMAADQCGASECR
jgi:hypothetical protein